MKEVNLISLISNRRVVGDYQDSLEFHSTLNNFARVSMSSEYMPELIEKETNPIHKVFDHGQEHYICVDSKVWEYLYLITNPVNAKSQEKKILELKDRSAKYFHLSNVNENLFINYRNRMQAAGFWLRVKWVFTGIN